MCNVADGPGIEYVVSMPPLINYRAFRGFTLWVLLVIASILLPRILPRGEGGLAAGATAAMIFLLIGAVAALVSVILLVQTIRRFRALTPGERLAGVIPFVVTCTGFTYLMTLLTY